MSEPAPGLPRGTVTLLFTDVEASTRLLTRLGERYRDALSQHRSLVRGAVARFDGREVDTQGDSFLVAFARARDAVAAAAAAQQALAAQPWPGGEELRVRMGIHTGEPDLVGQAYVGLDVHRAARVCAAAHGSQVLVTQAVRELVGDEPLAGSRFRDLGRHLLKDLPSAEHLFQLDVPGLAFEFPPPRTLDATALPVQPTRLVGRRGELARARELLLRDGVRLVTCTGPGGTGKTRLALEVAADLATEFRDGVFLVALGAVSEASLVAPSVAASLGLRELGPRAGVDVLREHLRSQQLLLVLDNFEHVAPAAPLVAELLAAAPAVKALVTSRAALRLSGEHELPVPPLSLPDAEHDGAASSEAAELFAERAAAMLGGFELTAANERVVAEICRRLDGLPLAIELAAARLKVLPPEELLDRLARRLQLLTSGARDVPERQRTLRHTLDWSYDLLPAEEQVLFEQLAVFVGGATLESIEAVCEPDEPLDLVAALVENNLVRRVDPPDGGARFTMLETVREYALERMWRRDDAGALARRHAEHFLALAEAAEPALSGERQAEWLARLESEHDNLRAAIDWLLGEGDAERALRFVASTTRFWRAQGHVGEARSRLERALADSQPVDPRTRARALWAAGRLAMGEGDLAAAEGWYAQALSCFRELGAAREEVFTLAELAWLAREFGRLDDAEELCMRAVELARTMDDARALSAALDGLAGVASEQGDHARARQLYEESLGLRRSLADPLLVANATLNLGMAALAEGAYDEALATLEECLAVARRVGDVVHTAAALCCLGELALLARNDVERAREHLREALRTFHDSKDARGVVECLHALAGVAAAAGDPATAARLWGSVERWRGERGTAPLPAELEIALRFVPLAVTELGEERFEAARAAGRSLALEETVADALALGRRSLARSL